MRREYPEGPVVAVGVIIHQRNPILGDQVVLVRRGQEPSRGLWTFPGGAVELGETIRDAARREALEETGLHVDVGKVVAVVDNVVYDEQNRVQYHYVIIDLMARVVGGSLRPGTDVSDARWARLEDVETLDMTEKARELARELLAGGSADA